MYHLVMDIEFLTKDNVVLSGYFMPAPMACATVMINPGTATKTSFYKPFAEFLVEQGFNVFLWNYRGFCESKRGSLKWSLYTYSDIGRYDIPAAISKAKSLAPELPLYCVGHSAGGQQLGLAYNFDQIAGLVAVAVSAGHFAYMPLGYRIKANFFFRVFAPLMSLLYKYVPASKFNFMEDLPSGLAKEWGDWCKDKDFLFSKKFYGKTVPKGHYKNFDMPIYVISADDDEISTRKNIESFWRHVESSGDIHFIQYKAADFSPPTLGHFGYFKIRNQKIWADILQLLKEIHTSKAR